MADEKILIDVEFDAATLAAKVKQARASLESLKTTLHNVEAEAAANGDTSKSTATAIARLQAAVKGADGQVKTYEAQLAALAEATTESAKGAQEAAQAQGDLGQQAGQTAAETETESAAQASLGERLAEVMQRTADLKAQQAGLRSEIREGGDDAGQAAQQYAENAAEIKLLAAEQKALEAEIAQSTQTDEQKTGSLAEMRQELNQLNAQYTQMSAAERESAQGQELLQHLDEMRQKVTEVEQSMGQYQRNVGNYKSATEDLIPGLKEINAVLKTLGTDIQSLATGGSAAFGTLGAAAKSFATLFITPPMIVIAAVLTAIAVAAKGVSDAIKRSDEAGTALKVAFAALQPVINVVKQAFDQLAKAVVTLVTGISQAYTAIMSLVPGYKAAAEAAQELVRAMDALEEAERQYAKNSAERQAEMQRLRNDALQEESGTYEERAAMLERAMELERQNTEEQRALMEERLRIRREEIEQEQGFAALSRKLTRQGLSEEEAAVEARKRLWSQLDDARKDELTEMESAITRLDAQYEQSVRRMQSQQRSLLSSAASEATEARKSMEAEATRIENLNVAILTQYKTTLISTLKDASTKAEAEENARWEKQRAALEVQLAERQSLSAEAEAALWDMLRIGEEQHQEAISEIRKAADEEEYSRAVAAESKRLDLELAKAKEGSEQARDIKMQQLELYYSEALKSTDLSEQERANLEEEWAQKRAAVQTEYEQAAFEAMKKVWESKAEAVWGKGLKAQRQQLAEELAAIKEMSDEMKEEVFGGIEDAENRMARLGQGMAELTAQVQEEAQAQMQATAMSVGESLGQIGDALTQISSDNVAFVASAQILGLAQVAINEGIAIANAVRAASNASNWIQAAIQIAAAVATVTATMASAISSIKGAAIPQAQTYATGGVVGGTSYSGDKVPAMVNSGEMILNREQQAAALRAMGVDEGEQVSKSGQSLLWQIVGGGDTSASSATKHFASGGIVGSISSAVAYTGMQQVGGVDLAGMQAAFRAAVEEMPAPIVDYKEFTRFSGRVAKYREYGKL